MTLFTILGVAAFLYVLYKLLNSLWIVFYPHVIAKILGHVVDVKRFGKWAVVTGATDGIGKGYAKALVRRGMNLLIISRSEEKLKATADELRNINSKVEIQTLRIDFQQATAETYQTKIADALKNIEIGILVNNVGMGYGYPEELTKTDPELFEKLLYVNCLSAVQMTRLVIPGMQRRGKGAIITISSAASFAPVPLYNVYSATKVFLDYFVRATSVEYLDSGITFQTVNPFYVKTNMSKLKRSSFWAPEPDEYAANALDTLGLLKVTAGCFSHELQHVAMKLYTGLMPTSKLDFQMLQRMKQIRATFLRRQERENKSQ